MAEQEKEKIQGKVVSIIFANEDNGYTVAEIDSPEFSFIAVGTMYGLNEGEKVVLTGEWTDHSTYGEQFKVDTYEKQMPKERNEIYTYLASGVIKGVGKSTAEKIVEKFGEESLDVISKTYERLVSISGISEKRAKSISESFNMQLGTSEIFMFLQKYSISANVCMKIYRDYKEMSCQAVFENPYILCDGEYGISFKKADEIAMDNEIKYDSRTRICAGIIYILRYSLQFGHTYLPEDILVSHSASLLGVSEDKIYPCVEYLLLMFAIKKEKRKEHTAVYLREYYVYEKNVSSKLAKLSKNHNDIIDSKTEKLIEIAQCKSSLKFADMQIEAIRRAISENVLVITGGPGTGKTTIINAIIDVMKSLKLKVALTAPTGRAAKRMTQVCGIEAKTIHRLLEVSFTKNDSSYFAKNESEPIDADVIIVDEVSMVDIALMDSLLRATRERTKLILVGDVNQLPSVGAGNVLKDIIDSKVVSVIRLKEVFRQSVQSTIVTNAHAINEGKYPVCNQENGDFYFAHIPSAEQGAQYICELVLSRLKNKYGYEPYDIQVLSPVKKGITGVNNLNAKLQSVLNPPSPDKKERKFGDIIFREGDKVMQTKNNYEIACCGIDDGKLSVGVFNGDIGYIKEVNHDFQFIDVIFDDKRTRYAFRDLGDLTLAYCITVHKSQGSEFPVVVIPMYKAPEMLLSRNLLYTGVTRAKELVVLVGNNDILMRMVDNDRQDKRYSGLVEKLTDELYKL